MKSATLHPRIPHDDALRRAALAPVSGGARSPRAWPLAPMLVLLLGSLLSCRRPGLQDSHPESEESPTSVSSSPNTAPQAVDAAAPTVTRPEGDGKPRVLTKDYVCDIAVSGSNVHYYGEKSLKHVPLQGGSPRTVAEGEWFSFGVDEQFVYYAMRGSNAIFKEPQGGGKRDLVVKTNNDVAAIAVDESYVYFVVNASGLHRVAKSGGEAERIGHVFEYTPLLVDDQYLYWYTSDGIRKLPKAGGEAFTLVDFAKIRDQATGSDEWIRNVGDLAQDDQYIYGRSADCGVYRVAKRGGDPEFIVHAKCDVGTHIAVGKSILFSTDTDLLEAPLEGGKSRVLLDDVEVVCSIVTGPHFILAGTGSLGLVRLDRP